MSPGPAKRRHPARWVAGSVLVLLVAAAVVAGTRPSIQASEAQSPLLDRPAPAFSGTSLTGGHVSLSEYRGRYLFVNFFASWCVPCQQEAPNLVQFSYEQDHQVGGAALVSVVYNDPNAAAKRFLATQGATWPALPDAGGIIASSYGVTGPPTTFLVNPRGTVVADLIGPAGTDQLDRLLASARRANG